tara:strand:+ start:1119 stop:1382 length:264 start_codon:yes stop_codon:yes gene_type:complete
MSKLKWEEKITERKCKRRKITIIRPLKIFKNNPNKRISEPPQNIRKIFPRAQNKQHPTQRQDFMRDLQLITSQREFAHLIPARWSLS